MVQPVDAAPARARVGWRTQPLLMCTLAAQSRLPVCASLLPVCDLCVPYLLRRSGRARARTPE